MEDSFVRHYRWLIKMHPHSHGHEHLFKTNAYAFGPKENRVRLAWSKLREARWLKYLQVINSRELRKKSRLSERHRHTDKRLDEPVNEDVNTSCLFGHDVSHKRNTNSTETPYIASFEKDGIAHRGKPNIGKGNWEFHGGLGGGLTGGSKGIESAGWMEKKIEYIWCPGYDDDGNPCGKRFCKLGHTRFTRDPKRFLGENGSLQMPSQDGATNDWNIARRLPDRIDIFGRRRLSRQYEFNGRILYCPLAIYPNTELWKRESNIETGNLHNKASFRSF